MAEVELAEDALIVHVRGMDRLWTLTAACISSGPERQ